MSVYSQYEKTIWDYLVAKIGNEYGVAGLMGNLYAESSLIPGRSQGDFTGGYYPSVWYTQQLNAGSISQNDFVYTKNYTYQGTTYGPAYGLAQWDYSPRRLNYWNCWTNQTFGAKSAGSLSFELDFLWYELSNDYASTLSVLQSATSVRQASDQVLVYYESPADQSESVKQTRAGFGQNLYNAYAGSSPSTDPDDPVGGDSGTAAWFAVFKKMKNKTNIALLRPKGGKWYL